MATIGLPSEELRACRPRHNNLPQDSGLQDIQSNDEPATKRLKPTIEAPQAVPTPRPVQSSIKASSLFSPASWDCSQCHERNNFHHKHCQGSGCGSPFKWSNTILSQTGREVDFSRFPVHWVCGTCCDIHSVLDIIMGNVQCGCGQPTLQAIYDQFGDLFLYWRDDAAIQDLKETNKAEEAARRLWLAGGDRWADAMPKIHLDEGKGKGKEREEDMVTVLVGAKVMC